MKFTGVQMLDEYGTAMLKGDVWTHSASTSPHLTQVTVTMQTFNTFNPSDTSIHQSHILSPTDFKKLIVS